MVKKEWAPELTVSCVQLHIGWTDLTVVSVSIKPNFPKTWKNTLTISKSNDGLDQINLSPECEW